MLIVVVFIFTCFLFLYRSKFSTQLAILILSFLFSSRTDLIPDALPYREMYQGLEYNIEPLFLEVCRIFKSLGFSFQSFLFILSLVLLESCLFATKRLLRNDNHGALLIILMSYFGIYYYGIVLRASISVTICYVGLSFLLTSEKKTKDFVLYELCVLLAMQFHLSSLFMSFIPLCLIRINNKLLYFVSFISLGLLLIESVIPIQQYLEQAVDISGFSRFTSYVVRETRTDRANLLYYLYVFISFLGVYFRKYLDFVDSRDEITYTTMLNIFVIATLLNNALWQIPQMARLPMLWLYFDFILIYYMIYRNRIRFVKDNPQMILLLYTAISFFGLIHYVPDLLKY